MTMQDNNLTIVPWSDPLERLPALAERLGVKPRPPDAPPSVVLTTRGGTTYDLFDLVNAALDRLDIAEKPP